LDCGTLYGFDRSEQIDAATILDSKELRAAYGLGIIWRSPMGKIRLDYGIPFQKEAFDKKQNFRIMMGANF
jgi:outer membrane protein insertion porin family